MRKPTRNSSRNNPAFDPSELEDLIHTPAVGRGVSSHLLSRSEPNMTTVVIPDMTPVVMPADILEDTDLTTVVMSMKQHSPVWISESGNYVGAGRVRPHIAAEDALSAAEMAVYTLLGNLSVRPEPGGGRTAQAGYQSIIQETGLSKKTVQRTIDKLLEKQFLAVAIPSDSHHRTPTTYTVFESAAILARHMADGRHHVARVGPGVAFVRPFSE